VRYKNLVAIEPNEFPNLNKFTIQSNKKTSTNGKYIFTRKMDTFQSLSIGSN